MKKLTRALLALSCGVAVCVSLSCGERNPAAPTSDAARVAGATTGDDGLVTSQAVNTMRWRISDRCPDGRGLQFRLFDVVNNQRFPKTGVFRVPIGGTATKAISCTTGHKICLGATTNPASPRYWGVGINGNRRSAAVLRSIACRACGPTTWGLFLICYGRADGVAPPEDGEGSLEESGAFEGSDVGESMTDEAGEDFIEE